MQIFRGTDSTECCLVTPVILFRFGVMIRYYIQLRDAERTRISLQEFAHQTLCVVAGAFALDVPILLAPWNTCADRGGKQPKIL